MKRFMSVTEMAEILGIGKTKAYELVKSDGFPILILDGRRYVIPSDEFEVWVKDNIVYSWKDKAVI